MSSNNSPDSADLREVRAAAMNYLSHREHGVRELETKLLRRGVEADVVEQVIAQLRSQDLVSDERYAEAYVRSRVNRLFGPVKIRAELRQRGIDEQWIDPAMEAYTGQWQEAADRWAAKKHAGDLDRKQQARIYRSGTHRGFTHEHMMRALERLKSGT